MISAEKTWSLVVAASTNERHQPGAGSFPHAVLRLYLDGCRVVRGSAELFPRAEDRSFDGYARRLEEATGRRYGLVVNEAQTLSWDLFDRAIPAALTFQDGRTDLLADVGIFAGNDRRSSFGVHLDEGYFGVRQFVVAGAKRAWLWDSARLSEDRRRLLMNAADFYDDRHDATVVDVAAGQSVTWSGSDYHVLETLTDHAVALSLALRIPGHAGVDSPLASAVRGLCAEVLDVDDRRLPLTERVASARQRLIEGLLDEASLERRVVARSLRRATSCGFLFSPPLRRIRRSPGDVLVRKPHSPIRWARTGSELLFACCGHHFEVESAPAWTEGFLTARETSPVSRLPELRRAAGVSEAERGVADEIVDALLASNGLELQERT